MDDWGDFGGASDGSGYDSDENPKSKGKKSKKKDSDDDGNESEPKEESDEGDFDQREVDYMSDVSSSDEEDAENAEMLNKELQGVEDEDALRQLVLSDEESEDEENKSNAKDKEPDEQQAKQQIDANGKPVVDKKALDADAKVKQEKKANNSDSSDSDDSDLDEKNFQSSLFMQKKEGKSVAVKKEPNGEPIQGQKRKLDAMAEAAGSSNGSTSQGSSSAVKRARLPNAETSLEEKIKGYLMRKPITTTELIKNMRKLKVANSKEELVMITSQILKKLKPQSQKISGKVYLYLDPKTQHNN